MYAEVRSPLRDMVVGKIRGEWKKIGVGGKNIFPMFCVLSQRYLRSLEKLCVPSQNFCVLSQRYLRSLAKLLRSLAKIFAFPRKYICVLSRNFAFPRKIFAFSRKDICVPSQNFGVLTSCSTLFVYFAPPVVQTAPYIHNGAVHRILLWTWTEV